MLKKFLLLLLLSGCGNNKTSSTPSFKSTINESYLPLNAVLPVSISTLFDKPTIIFLAGQYCQTCIEEAIEVKDYYLQKSEKFSGVNLLTILVSAVNEDVQDWQSERQLPWLVGSTEDSHMVKKYCPAVQTPCTLVVKNGEIIFSENGKVDPKKLEQLTTK